VAETIARLAGEEGSGELPGERWLAMHFGQGSSSKDLEAGVFYYLAHLLYGRAEVRPAKESGAANERIGSDVSALGGSFKINPSVHADAIGKAPLRPPGMGLLDLGQRFINESLSTKAGVDGHD